VLSKRIDKKLVESEFGVTTAEGWEERYLSSSLPSITKAYYVSLGFVKLSLY